MNERIIDKSILLILSLAAILLGLSSASDVMTVTAFLAAVIIGAAAEIIRERRFGAATSAGTMILMLYNPVFALIAPIAVYSMFGTVGDLKDRNGIIAAAGKMCTTAAFVLVFGFSYEKNETSDGREKLVAYLVFSALCIVSAVFAVKAERSERMKLEMLRKYDDAREEAGRALGMNKIAMQSVDDEIYTATLRERNRIAREIHDNVGHMLTRALVQLQALSVINRDAGLSEHIEQLKSTLNDAMTSIRKSVHELHDDSIDLSIAVNEIADTIKDAFCVSVVTSLESPVPNDVKTAITAIVKESVTNIAKYSRGKNVKIDIAEHNTFWRVRIKDDGECVTAVYDGSGISEESGMGLENIRSRAGKLGGRAGISSDRSGFTVFVTIPKKEE